MSRHQIHFGRKFNQDKKTGYWLSTDLPRIRAHRWVWINIHGNIPQGYHIHHKDENKSNNSIKNLELIERSRHFRHHATEEKRQWARKWASVIRPLTKKWHASEEGRAWHKLHALKNGLGHWTPKTYICQQCDKKFKSTKKNRVYFCSNACKSQRRRQSGVDDEERICFVCQKKFIINRYFKTKTCDRKCREELKKMSKLP